MGKIPEWQKNITLKDIQNKLQDKFAVEKTVSRTEFVIYLECGDAIKVLYVDNHVSKVVIDGKHKEEIEEILKN